MKTRIDRAVTDFVMTGIAQGVVTEKLQELLDYVREQFSLDVVYILDRANGDDLFTYKCMSVSKPEYDNRGLMLRVPMDEWDTMLHMYDDDPVCDYNIPSIADSSDFSNNILHYGFVRKKLRIYDGSVGFQMFSPHEWTDEERAALRLLGAAYKALLSVSLAEGSSENMLESLRRERTQYREALINGCLYSVPIDLTDGMIREQFTTSSGMDILKTVGLRPPVHYDVIAKAYSERMGIRFVDESNNDCLTVKGLLRRFEQGRPSAEWEYYINDERCIRVTFYMYRDRSTEHVLGLMMATDVTEIRRSEERHRRALQDAYDAANQANDAKTRFLSNMSHDIRTPMNGIIGMTAIAAAHLDDKARVEDCLTKITTASKHLLGLINEVLDMSKIESGKVELQDEEFSLSDSIEQILTIAKPQMESREHKFKVMVNHFEHEDVIGDAQRIQQVFLNLLSNAAKYTPNGGSISFAITEKPLKNPALSCYEFIVEDNGIGMDAEFVKKIYEPFVRAEDKRVGGIQGTGLGMTIARTIVQMMNGDIRIDSQPNKGTRITVTLYLQLQNEKPVENFERFAQLPVLVADDEESSCEYTCMVLDELGMNSEYVLSGKEAVERVTERSAPDQQQYFAIILDWKMPGMDGLETAREISKRVGGDVPIIILSGYDWSAIELEARSAGVSAFIGKPLFKSKLSALFKGLMERNGAEGASALDRFKQKDFSGKRALLVEDNELNAEIATEILSMTGLTVEHASDGQEAVSMVVAGGEDYYDIVFMDIQMPVMNGYDATRAIRALSGKYIKELPIIAMTANAFSSDITAAKKAGMNEHLAKPIDFEQLVKTLNCWVG